MKKQILAALAVCALGVATAAFAAPGDGINGGPHDMRSRVGVQGDLPGTGRTCAFCHTPHHAMAAGTGLETYLPLWSRATDTTTFTTPYASATIDAAELNETTSDKAIGPTRLCMSCHDGSIAPDQHYSYSGGATALTGDSFLAAAGGGAGVGAGAVGLSNDHPVGFSYTDVAVGPSGAGTNPTAAQIQAAAAAGGQDPWIRQADATFLNNTYQLKIQDRLYASGGKLYMTCATCHDVHNKKNSYPGAAGETVNYLVLAGQANSDLCLSCHIK